MKNDKKTLILSAVLSLIEKGSKKENIKVADIAKEAGADVIVAGSSVFGAEDMKAAIEYLGR